MEEDRRLTPRPWWANPRFTNYPRYHARRPTSAWRPGAAALGVCAVAFPILVLALTKL